jgi:hypothetical protein
MSQFKMKRAHVALDGSIYATIAELALQSKKDRKITAGALVAAAVFCALPRLEEKLPRKFFLNKVEVDPKKKDRMEGGFIRMHVYFGKHGDLYERANNLAEKHDVSISWIVRQCCRVCVPVFKVKVPKGKSFKCLGSEVTID